jgi:hypothetical protein
MPVRFNKTVTSPGTIYGRPFIGPTNHTAQISVDITLLTAAEVDSFGYLKPGVPFTAAGILVGAAAIVFGVTPEPLDVLHILPYSGITFAAALAAAGVQQLAVCTIGQVNRKIMEDNLGRVLTANEIAGFGLAGCLIKLLA